jgi:CDP-ribitol ribitolphosphotransferase
MIEFALLNKPIVFFTYDYDSYLNNERGFYFDFKSTVPGPVVYDSNQLIDVIKNHEFDESRILEFVKTQFDEIDGHASERVVDYLLK